MTDNDRAALRDDLKLAEGWRSKAYQDSVGVWTIGYGTNLQELEIDESLGAQWLEQKMWQAEDECSRTFPWFAALSPVRQRVLVEMTYNLGLTKLLKFKATLAAVKSGDYDLAASQMLKSLWAKQVGRRAVRLANMMRTG